jgi:hypothetical protein
VLNPTNTAAPWLVFEAGAISKSVSTSRVCGYCLKVDKSNVGGPLAQFQNGNADREHTSKLVHAINEALEKPLAEKVLQRAFELCWPQLEKDIDRISAKLEQPSAVVAKRPDRELLEELLGIARSIATNIDNTNTEAVRRAAITRLSHRLAHDNPDYLARLVNNPFPRRATADRLLELLAITRDEVEKTLSPQRHSDQDKQLDEQN